MSTAGTKTNFNIWLMRCPVCADCPCCGPDRGQMNAPPWTKCTKGHAHKGGVTDGENNKAHKEGRHCSLSVDDSNKEVYDQYYNTASNIKLTSLLATDTVDVLITVPQMFSYYTAQNACLDLSSFLSEDLYEKLEKENRLLIAVDGGGNKICTGISLDDSYLSSKLPLSDESSLSVCTDKNHPDVIQDFIKYCLWGK